MSDLRGALAISNDVHAELMEAVRDGREPARVAAAAAARHAPLRCATLACLPVCLPACRCRKWILSCSAGIDSSREQGSACLLP